MWPLVDPCTRSSLQVSGRVIDGAVQVGELEPKVVGGSGAARFRPVVTSLTAEAASFFSRRLGMKGQSSPQDVACGMFVGLSGVTAPLADELRLGDAVLACCVSAGLAAI
jgi:hypothetical protein